MQVIKHLNGFHFEIIHDNLDDAIFTVMISDVSPKNAILHYFRVTLECPLGEYCTSMATRAFLDNRYFDVKN